MFFNDAFNLAVPFFLFSVMDGGCCCWGLSAILYLPAVLIGTPVYILYILISGCIKVLFPDIESSSDRDLENEVVFGLRLKNFQKYPNMLRTAEVVTESYPQSILGKY